MNKKKIITIISVVLGVAIVGTGAPVLYGWADSGFSSMYWEKYSRKSNHSDTYIDETIEEDYPIDNNPNEEEYKLPVKEWGFSNMYDYDYKLIRIKGYDITGSENDYVIYEDNYSSIVFENGYKMDAKIDTETGKLITGDYPYRYTVVNNDLIDIQGESRGLKISERKTSSNRDNFVVFVQEATISYSECWYVPYSLIDWTRLPEKYEEEKKKSYGEGTYIQTYYRLFLKPQD